MYTYSYPRPAVAVDVAIFRPADSGFQVLLIKRGKEPFQGEYALPGGFLDPEETLEESASRELREETALEIPSLQQIQVFSDPDRDPRGRVISVCFGGILEKGPSGSVQAGDDASAAGWFSMDQLPTLAFDHQLQVEAAASRLLPDFSG